MSLNTYDVKIEPGVVLVARPELMDPRFVMSVVLLCHHDEKGSVGLILNRPTSMLIDTE